MNDGPGVDADLQCARRIADQLASSGVWSRGVCAFHGAAPPPEPGLPALHRSFGADTYEGSAGVARFLALAARLTDDDDLAHVARGALRHAIARHEGWSLFSGGSGVALVAFEVAAWLDEPALARDAGRIMSDAARAALFVRDTASGDLLSGLAGVIVALTTALQIASGAPDSGHWRTAALDLGAHLLQSAQRRAGGLSWPLRPDGGPHLCGLGHGTSGVALALEALARIDPDPRWRDAAREARNYERSWYSAEQGSWADLRSEIPAYPHMWCHGSVGIAAERLADVDTADDLGHTDLVAGLSGARSAAERLVVTPCGSAAGDELNASQCHGLGGMADLFVSAWAHDGNDAWLALARACTAQMRRDTLRPAEWRCGVIGGHRTPGLMLGLAGIGWAQMRAARPREVPSAWRLGVGAELSTSA